MGCLIRKHPYKDSCMLGVPQCQQMLTRKEVAQGHLPFPCHQPHTDVREADGKAELNRGGLGVKPLLVPSHSLSQVEALCCVLGRTFNHHKAAMSCRAITARQGVWACTPLSQPCPCSTSSSITTGQASREPSHSPRWCPERSHIPMSLQTCAPPPMSPIPVP